MTGTSTALAAEYLHAGKVVGIPTETVYGLAANAFNEDAVISVFKIKKRPFFDPLIIHTHSAEQAQKYVLDFPEQARKLAEQFWPGPLTLLLPKTRQVPDLVTSGSDLVAIRIPDHPLTLELLRMLDFPLAAPSANPFGYISPTRPEHVEAQLGEQVAYILDGGECGIGLESTIVDCSGTQPRVFRLGGLSLKSIEECIGMPVQLVLSAGSNPSAPGQLDKHYAPRTPFILCESLNEMLLMHRHKKLAVLGFGTFQVPDDVYALNLSTSGNLDEAARNLFHYMRLLDNIGPELIIALKVPDTGLGAAINDRLRRAGVK